MSLIYIFGAQYLFLLVTGFFVGFFLWQKKETQKKMIKLSVIALPLSYFLAKIAGFIFYNPRPFVSDGIKPLIYHIADNGFPSDHTLLCATLSFIVYFFDKKIGTILVVISLLVGVSRVLVGVHHWVDVLGSVFIAGGAVFVIYTMIRNTKLGKWINFGKFDTDDIM